MFKIQISPCLKQPIEVVCRKLKAVLPYINPSQDTHGILLFFFFVSFFGIVSNSSRVKVQCKSQMTAPYKP